MSLIACPECDHQVSDLAVACPHCGFPVAAAIRHTVAELTDEVHAKSARQQHAAQKLRTWGQRYKPEFRKQEIAEGETFFDRHWRPIVVVVALVILAIQLTWVLSLYR